MSRGPEGGADLSKGRGNSHHAADLPTAAAQLPKKRNRKPSGGVVREREFAEPYTSNAPLSEPRREFTQTCYDLTEHEFKALINRNSTWSQIGAPLAVTGLTAGALQTVYDLATPALTLQQVTLTKGLVVLALVIGLVMMIVGWAHGGDRRKVKKEIQQHFKDYPGRKHIQNGEARGQ